MVSDLPDLNTRVDTRGVANVGGRTYGQTYGRTNGRKTGFLYRAMPEAGATIKGTTRHILVKNMQFHSMHTQLKRKNTAHRLKVVQLNSITSRITSRIALPEFEYLTYTH